MIKIFENIEILSRAAADLIVGHAREAVDRRGRFGVALSGGRTPRRTYQLLAQPPWRDQTPWPHTIVFWGDERCVAPDDARSNARMAYEALLNHVPVSPENVHPLRCDRGPQSAAARYEELLRARLTGEPPVFDLILLGLGQDGHTASLFPESAVLEEGERLAAEVYAGEQKLYRVTLTPPVINAARSALFLVSGREKAGVLKAVLEGPPETRRLPAQLIRPRSGRPVWMADRAAASLLSQSAIAKENEGKG